MQGLLNIQMVTRTRLTWCVLAPAVFLLLAIRAACPQSEAGAALTTPAVAVAVIAHSDVSMDTLTRDQLLDYFTGDRQEWPDGTRVVIKELKIRGGVRTAFYDFIGQRPSRLKSIWLRNMLSGEGERPESLDSAAAMIECIVDTPGSIGFVDADQVADARVKTLILIDRGRE